MAPSATRTQAPAPKATAAPRPAPKAVPPVRSSAPPLRPTRQVAAPPALRLSPTVAAISGGERLAPVVQGAVEKSLQVDTEAVRVHSDIAAQIAARRLAARAFTVGNHIFLGAGERPTDTRLMAHEMAHVVQQRGLQQGGAPTLQRLSAAPSDRYEHEAERAATAVQQGSHFAVHERTGGPRPQRLGLSDILDGLAELAANVPGFTLLTVIIGRNPINMRVVERNAINVLRAFMGLIPGGEILFQILNRYGVIQRLGDWVIAQANALGLSFQSVRDAFTRFTDSLSWTDIFSPGDVWNRAKNIFTPLITRITTLVSGLISQAITWLKETFMEPLSSFCREIPGYGLVTVLLGRDPFTNQPVPRTALNVVRAFAEFIPGGTEKVNQLIESRALERAYQWFIQETTARNLTWARVSGTFMAAWNSLRLEDVLSPLETLRRIVGMFRPLMGDLISFAGAALMKLLELIFEAVMGAGGARILAILKRARATFLIIIQNPVGFLRNLLGAVGQGIRQFMRNILTHLRDGVIAWLTGPVARAGIQMPERWDLRGIIWFVLQILGLTWDRIRAKLVRLLGERVVAGLEAGFALLQEIRQKGIVQALRDRVTEFFGQLRDAALGSIRSFIQQRLVMAGITQLISLLNPVGAIIQAIIKTYTTIQFFIQRINQILDLVESIVNSIAAIASGAIGAAAAFVERTMARTIPIILDFLARFIGLGDVGGQVQRTIRGLQARVDQMLDRAVDWIRRQAQNILSRVLGGQPDAPPAVRVANALREAVPIVNRYAGRTVGAAILRPLLLPVKLRHRLTSLTVVAQGDRWFVDAAASPGVMEPTDAKVEGGATAASDLNRQGALASVADRTAAIAAMTAIANKNAPGIQAIAQLSDAKFTQYKSEYISTYAPGKRVGDNFQWPHFYLRTRAARRAGYDAEAIWRPIVFPGSAPASFDVTRPDGTTVEVIPDVLTARIVGDIKNWASLSLTRQLQDFVLIANPSTALSVRRNGRPYSARRKFEVAVRHDTHSQGRTEISGPLQTAVTASGGNVHYAITDHAETADDFTNNKNWPKS